MKAGVRRDVTPSHLAAQSPAELGAHAHYTALITELKARVASARTTAARAVNYELIELYWDIGRRILDSQRTHGWGKSVVDRLARDLQREFDGARGFSARNLWDMRRLYQEYSEPLIWRQLVAKLEAGNPGPVILQQAVAETEPGRRRKKAKPAILRQPVAEFEPGRIPEHRIPELLAAVPWGHHLLVLNKVRDLQARCYYLQATARLGWTRTVLLNQIKARAYERSRTSRKTHNFTAAMPAHLAEQAGETLKSSYNLEFLGIGKEIRERELEDRLTERLKDFILELGYGFCFIGRQHRLVLGKKEYFIDLLFYHRFLQALVAVELKIGGFVPEYAGKMDFYLNLLNDKERGQGDNPSIGIILCAEKDNLEVEFALKSKGNPIGVAEYQLQPRLPSGYRGKLPTPRQLEVAFKGYPREH